MTEPQRVAIVTGAPWIGRAMTSGFGGGRPGRRGGRDREPLEALGGDCARAGKATELLTMQPT